MVCASAGSREEAREECQYGQVLAVAAGCPVLVRGGGKVSDQDLVTRTYELMRLGAANYRFRVVRWLLAPGLALQGLTTREPDDSMIECAIVSLKRVMQRDAVAAEATISSEAALPPLVATK